MVVAGCFSYLARFPLTINPVMEYKRLSCLEHLPTLQCANVDLQQSVLRNVCSLSHRDSITLTTQFRG